MKKSSFVLKFLAAAALALAPGAALAADVVALPATATQAAAIDYQNAVPLPLPQAPAAAVESGAAVALPGESGFGAGFRGDGKLSPAVLFQGAGSDLAVEPQEYGTSNHPFSTSRVDMYGVQLSRYYPYRAAGKLFFKIGTGNYICSASLIKRGIVVTAAHCVTQFGAGTGGAYSAFQFVPAYYNGVAPYGVWTANRVFVKSAYVNGTDVCAPGATGVVCQNDVAIIRLNKTAAGTLPGTSTGWLGYGYGGYGFTGANLALFTQLGYPASHDQGKLMQRTDSQAFVDPANANNSVWGSRQTGGSSGGPEIVNFGQGSSLVDTAYGAEAGFNRVVGVTSWGYTDPTVKQQGASPFLSTNVQSLLTTACASPYTTWCQ